MLASETLSTFFCILNSWNIFCIFTGILHWTRGYVLLCSQNLQLLLEKMAFWALRKPAARDLRPSAAPTNTFTTLPLLLLQWAHVSTCELHWGLRANPLWGQTQRVPGARAERPEPPGQAPRAPQPRFGRSQPQLQPPRCSGWILISFSWQPSCLRSPRSSPKQFLHKSYWVFLFLGVFLFFFFILPDFLPCRGSWKCPLFHFPCGPCCPSTGWFQRSWSEERKKEMKCSLEKKCWWIWYLCRKN